MIEHHIKPQGRSPLIGPHPRVNPVVRVVLNSLVASTLAGSTAYLAWLLGVPQWFALMLGTAVLVVYGIIWLGNIDDPRNA